MRGLMIIARLAALMTLVTPLIAPFTGDRESALMLALVALVTLTAFFTSEPRRPRSARQSVRQSVQGD